MGKIFLLIQILLKLFGAWEGLLDWIDENHSAEMDARALKRNAAVDNSAKADTDDEIWKNQKEIVDTLPNP